MGNSGSSEVSAEEFRSGKGMEKWEDDYSIFMGSLRLYEQDLAERVVQAISCAGNVHKLNDIVLAAKGLPFWRGIMEGLIKELYWDIRRRRGWKPTGGEMESSLFAKQRKNYRRRNGLNRGYKRAAR